MSADNRIVIEDTLDMMIDYCKDTAMILHRIGDIEKLKDDAMNQYALAGPIQQLGECTRRIDLWLNNHYEYEWSDIIGLRNILSHHYKKLDLDLLWTIANEDVPRVMNILLELKSKLQDYPDGDYLNIRTNRSD